MLICEEMLDDSKADKTLEYTKHDIATRLKQILGEDGWQRCQKMFPLLRDYWEEDDGK